MTEQDYLSKKLDAIDAMTDITIFQTSRGYLDNSLFERVRFVYNRALRKVEDAGGLDPQHEFHNLDTAGHMRAVVDAAKNHDFVSPALVQAAMLHDVGKYEVAEPKEGGGYRFPKHELASARMAANAICTIPVVRVVQHHGWIQQLAKKNDDGSYEPVVSPKGFCKFIRRLTKGFVDRDVWPVVHLYINLAECDAEGFSEMGKAQRLAEIEVFRDMLEKHWS